MPYRRYKKRSKTRVGAAQTLQRAWRSKLRKKRGSVLQRQTLANKRAIKVLKKAPEVKRIDGNIASVGNNYSGSILQETAVDNLGMSQDTPLWATTAVGNFLPNASSYQPLQLCPMYLKQGDGEKERIGNKIKMRNLIIKGTVYGGLASSNGGVFENQPWLQKMRIIVLHDSDPAPENTTLGVTPSTWQFAAMGFQTFEANSNYNNASTSTGSSVPDTQLENLSDRLYELSASGADPVGFKTGVAGLAQRDLTFQAFRHLDTLDKKRFKILKTKVISVSQVPPLTSNYQNENRAANSRKDFCMVVKAPYVFHYPNDKAFLPDNSRLYICCASDCPTQRGAGGVPATDWVMPPKIQMSCRINFTDA